MPKKIINILLLALIALLPAFKREDFKSGQLKYPRVRTAYAHTWKKLQDKLQAIHVDHRAFSVYLRLFKEESQLEVWVRTAGKSTWQLLTTYPVCAKSGGPGPKRRQGDGQVPEGFYKISGFNPASSYHLSMGINYPNASDLKKSSGDPGGDIMIHGRCVTIGCVPIEDGPIEELYVLCVEARNRGKTIEAHFLPKRFTAGRTETDKANKALWTSLKEVQTYFDLNHIVPNIAVDTKGDYVVSLKKP